MSADVRLLTLKLVNYKITSVPVRDLPYILPDVVDQLQSCADILSADTAVAKASTERAAALHKFRTRVSTLLQDRTVEGRWAAVVLVKTSVELGQWDILQNCAAWVRGMINVLNKPDPPSTKKLCIISLTRVFMLTRDHPSLLRDITTPSLPPFLTACLNQFQRSGKSARLELTGSQHKLLECVLESFACLIPRHPTIFRSFSAQLRVLLSHLVTGSGMDNGGKLRPEVPLGVKHLASRVLVQLHHCAPKAGSSDEWNQAIKALIHAIHTCADQIFRPVIETWESTAEYPRNVMSKDISDEPKQEQNDSLLLPAWSGQESGTDRLVELLNLLRHYLTTATAFPVQLPLGQILDLLTRVLALIPPLQSEWSEFDLFRHEISKQERENLWVLLPDVHVAAIGIITAVVERLGAASIPTCTFLMEQLTWIFNAARSHMDVRTAVYLALAGIVNIIGRSLDSSGINGLEAVVLGCCQDVLRMKSTEGGIMEQHRANKAEVSVVVSPDAPSGLLNQKAQQSHYPGLIAAAQELLSLLLGRLSAKSTPARLRAETERAAVLTSDCEAMIAASLNPGGHSILPLFAQINPEHPTVEAIVRPRLPVHYSQTATNGLGEDIEVDDELSRRPDSNHAAERLWPSVASGETASQFLVDRLDNPNASTLVNATETPTTQPPTQQLHETPFGTTVAATSTSSYGSSSKRPLADPSELSRPPKQSRLEPAPSSAASREIARISPALVPEIIPPEQEAPAPKRSASDTLVSATAPTLFSDEHASISQGQQPAPRGPPSVEPAVEPEQQGIDADMHDDGGGDEDEDEDEDDEDTEIPPLVFKGDSDSDSNPDPDSQ